MLKSIDLFFQTLGKSKICNLWTPNLQHVSFSTSHTFNFLTYLLFLQKLAFSSFSDFEYCSKLTYYDRKVWRFKPEYQRNFLSHSFCISWDIKPWITFKFSFFSDFEHCSSELKLQQNVAKFNWNYHINFGCSSCSISWDIDLWKRHLHRLFSLRTHLNNLRMKHAMALKFCLRFLWVFIIFS